MNKKLMRGLCTVALMSSACFALASCNDKPAPEGTTSNATTTTTVVDGPKDDANGYHLLWKDEFDGTKLDSTIWNRQLRPRGWTNHELQEYVADEANGFIRDGKFVIKGIESVDEEGNTRYTSCKLDTQNKQDFMYGKVEVSAKVPSGKGLWPAIWMMPTDESYYGQWPKCGEIDIMEVLGHETNKTYGTVHYGEPHAEQQGSKVLENGTFADSFHTYAVEWEPGFMRWYVDGEEILYVNDWFTAELGQDEKAYPAPFNQTFFLQINLAIGGDWPGDPEPGADYMANAEFEIDYVRVYQKSEYPKLVHKPKKEFRDPDETGNYITNADFSKEQSFSETKSDGWVFYTANGGAGTATVSDGKVVIASTANGDVDYGVQLYHKAIPMFKDTKYKISFDIYSDAPRTINEICIDAPNAGWSRYWAISNFECPQELTHYEYTFTMKEKTDNATRLEFNMGNTDSTATIYITNVRVEKVEE